MTSQLEPGHRREGGASCRACHPQEGGRPCTRGRSQVCPYLDPWTQNLDLFRRLASGGNPGDAHDCRYLPIWRVLRARRGGHTPLNRPGHNHWQLGDLGVVLLLLHPRVEAGAGHGCTAPATSLARLQRPCCRAAPPAAVAAPRPPRDRRVSLGSQLFLHLALGPGLNPQTFAAHQHPACLVREAARHSTSCASTPFNFAGLGCHHLAGKLSGC